MLNNIKISKGVINLIEEKLTKSIAPTAEFADGISTIIDVRSIFNDIYSTLDTLDIIYKVYPHVTREPDAVATLLGVEALGLNTLANSIKNGFMMLRNFFYKLKDAVVSFFKYLFDRNAKTRKQLSTEMRKYNQVLAMSNSSTPNNPVVSLISYGGFNSTIGILNTLFNEAQSVYKADNQASITANSSAIQAFGYKIEDDRIVGSGDVPEFPKQNKPINSSDGDWGWNIQALTAASNELLLLCSKAEKLNYIKDKINNSVKSATYTIDRLNSVGNSEAAIKVQTKLNEVALVSGYLFNCAAVFQKKVDFLAYQLIEAWYTLNSVTAR